MNRNALGRTNVHVTDLGFGAAPIGNLYKAIDDETAHAAVLAAWDGGVRYFDTAPHYGLGLAERRVGAALRDKPRADFVLSTKVGRLLVDNPHPTGSDLDDGGFAVRDDLARELDYSRDGVLRSLDASLERLGMDRIDVVYIHDAEESMDQAVTEAVPALAQLRDQGVVGAIGAGMNFTAPLLRFVTESDVDAVMLAGRWTLADRSGEPLLTACAERGVSVVAAAPFNSGCSPVRIPARKPTSTTNRRRRTSSAGPGRSPRPAHGTARSCRTPPSASPCGTRPSPASWRDSAPRTRPGPPPGGPHGISRTGPGGT